MKVEHITASQKKALTIATAASLVLGALFLRNYLTLFIFAAILAFSFNPFYHWRLRNKRSPNSAAAQTLVVTILAIIVPLLVVVVLTGMQINHTLHTLTAGSGINITKFSQLAIQRSNDILEKTPATFRVTPEWLGRTEASIIDKAGAFIQHNIASYTGSVFRFFTTVIIFMFVFVSLLKNQEHLRRIGRTVNPLGQEISSLYATRVSAMTKAMVRGQFIIALAQGFTDAALLYVGGLHSAFLFMLMLLTVLSFIPLGGGIVAIPIGLIMILSGNVLGGVYVIAGHLLLVTNIDNVLRPLLVPPEARLDPALTIVSVFAGIALFGFLGIVVGPVIMILIATTVEVYLQVHRPPVSPKPKRIQAG